MCPIYLWVQFEFRFDAQWVPANLDAILGAIELYSGIKKFAEFVPTSQVGEQ